jgi:3-deoxy-D-manno-octulosonic-acid transferase
MYFLYRLFTALSMIVLAPYYAVRGWRRDEPKSAGERLGNVPPEIIALARKSPGPIWIHAVSVGEVLAAQPLAEALREKFPGIAIFVSTTTETGQRLARERLKSVDGIFYFPLDWIVPVRRALGSIHPAIVIVTETEIWPNFLREAHRLNVPVIFANARISEKSFARFQRYERWIGPFFRRTLQDARLFLAQTPDDAARLRAMGVAEDCIEVSGNLKYDAEPPAASPFGEWLAQQIRAQERWPVVVAGSVVAEEEQAVVAAYDIIQRKWRHALLILAPRKPDRFDAAAAIAAEGGWNVVRRSALDLVAPLDENTDVLVLDSIGELAGLYALADAAFVGGSLVPSGGHNILEPAWFAKPPVFGPSMENFRDMAAQFLSAKAGIQVSSGPMLGKVWEQLIDDKSIREKMGAAARALCERNRGATARSLQRIAAVFAQRAPQNPESRN